MTHRLNMGMRDEITTRLLKHRFSKTIQAYYKATAEFAEAVWQDNVSKVDQEVFKLIPEGWLPMDDHISATFGHSGYENVYFGGKRYPGAELVNVEGNPPAILRAMPAKLKGRCIKAYDARHPLAVEYERLQGIRSGLVREIEQTRLTLRQAIKNVHTLEKLVEKWPEVTPLIADLLTAEPRMLPTVPTARLNELLDLPVKETDDE